MAPSPDPPHPHPGPDFSFERQAIAAGLHPVAGLDEVGRGPLAGPVVVAAVILDPANIPAGLDDSKKLGPRRREALFGEILGTAHGIAVASVCAEAIDRGNIRLATLEAMRRAVLGLSQPPRFVLVDGRDVPPGLPCPARAVVGGDARSQSIAAASIVAKVMRDRMLAACGATDPRYGFGRHAGYGTAAHRQAIAAHGPLPRLHRLTFAPLRKG